MILNTFDFITCKIIRQIIARQDNLLGKVSLIRLIVLINWIIQKETQEYIEWYINIHISTGLN